MVGVREHDAMINNIWSNQPFTSPKYAIFQSKKTPTVTLVGEGGGNSNLSVLISTHVKAVVKNFSHIDFEMLLMYSCLQSYLVNITCSILVEQALIFAYESKSIMNLYSACIDEKDYFSKKKII